MTRKLHEFEFLVNYYFALLGNFAPALEGCEVVQGSALDVIAKQG